MERLLTFSELLPDHFRWQAVSFMRVVWQYIYGGALRATYPPTLRPVHHLIEDDDLLLAYAATFVQVLQVSGSPTRVGCLGNVFTCPGARRQGRGRRVVAAATQHLRDSDVDFGALLCDAELGDFYRTAGWTPATGPTLVDVPGGGPPEEVDALRMVLPVSPRSRATEAAAGSQPLRVPFPW